MPPQVQVSAASLVAELDRWTGQGCRRCGVSLCGHFVLCSVVLGLKDCPRCPTCLALGLRQPLPELLLRLTEYVQRRECYRTAWTEACDREGVARTPHPECLGVIQDQERHNLVEDSCMDARETPADEEWDAGTLGCGDLVLQLRHRLRSMAPGQVLRLTAYDPGAAEDLPSWCRMTGHSLIRAVPPVFWIQRKEN